MVSPVLTDTTASRTFTVSDPSLIWKLTRAARPYRYTRDEATPKVVSSGLPLRVAVGLRFGFGFRTALAGSRSTACSGASSSP